MKNFFAVCGLVLVTACAGTAPPQSLDEGLAYAEGQVSGAEQSAAAAVGAKTISPATAQKVLTIGDQAMAALKAARAAEASGDLTTAQGKLSAATALLAQIAALLPQGGTK